MDPSLCQRPMKVWEFMSAFRWSDVSLIDLVHDERWVEPYGKYFDQFDQLVQSQDRAVLDSPVPIELSRAAASLCDDLLFTISDDGNIRRLTSGDESASALSATHIHDNFGGAIIEDVLEKGSYRLPDTLWPKRAEQADGGKRE